jgi:hypothetical protein
MNFIRGISPFAKMPTVENSFELELDAYGMWNEF